MLEYFKELFLIFISASIINNFVLYRFLGICPFLGVSKKTESAFGMGMAVAFVMLVATFVTWLIQKFVLDAFGLPFLRTVAFILVIASLVQIIELVLKKINPKLYDSFGIFLALITTNCAILGLVILNVEKQYNLVEALVHAVGAAAGFIMALLVMSGIRERLEYADIPKPLRGVPIALIIAGLLAMAFVSGFAGMM